MSRKKRFEYRFYPTEEQAAMLANVFGHTRFVWNRALELRTDSYYEEGKSLTYTDTSRKLTELKKKTWLREVSSVALQQKLRDLGQAFENFFEGRCGSSNFKSKHDKRAARFVSNALGANDCGGHRKTRDASRIERFGLNAHGPVSA